MSVRELGSLFTHEGDAFVPTALSTGPWSPDSLHGGPVAALLAHLLELEPTVAPMFPARLTIELLAPVGHAPLHPTTRVVRPGRKVQVLEATLHADRPDRPVARATLQQIRRGAVDLPADLRRRDPIDPPPSSPEALPRADSRFFEGEAPAFHNAAVEHRSDHRFFGQLGPAYDWIRVTADLLPGVTPSPLARVAAAADFGNGVSATLPVTRYLFVNPDLSIFLTRLPVDEWVGLDARTHIGDDGVGLAESVLYDRDGRLGRAVQMLLVDRGR